MNKPVLVIMAAGMGSRYGGLKQIDPIGPNGQIILDYSVYDAHRAGFERVVFIIRPELHEAFEEAIGRKARRFMQVDYAYQTLDNLPEGLTAPEGREKPLGTAHAVWCAKKLTEGCPIAVINADDFYGADAFRKMYDYLSKAEDDDKFRYCMVGYQVENTLTENGTVSRGVCTEDENVADEVDFDRDWLDDARRYYTNIVGKYGASVQALLKKASGLEIAVICPLHGPIWRENLGYILEKYQKWSTYEAEDQAVVILYATMYGNTASAADALAGRLAAKGVKKIAVYDVSNTHVSELISEIFRASHVVFAAPTYNGGIYPVMENLLADMKALAVQNKTVALMENGTWAPMTAKQMREKLAELKNVTILDTQITIKSAMAPEQEGQLEALADAIVASMDNQ